MKTESQNLKIESQKSLKDQNRGRIESHQPNKIPNSQNEETDSLRGCSDFYLKTFSCFCAVHVIFSKNLDAGFRKRCGWQMHGTSIPFQDMIMQTAFGLVTKGLRNCFVSLRSIFRPQLVYLTTSGLRVLRKLRPSKTKT